MRVAEPGHSGRQVVIGGALGQLLISVAERRELAAIDRVVDRLPEAHIAEQRPVCVQNEVVELEERVDEVLLAAVGRGRASGPVAGGERCGERCDAAVVDPSPSCV